MTDEVRFTIVGDPVPKGRPRHGRNGHAFTPQRTRDEEARIRAAAAELGVQPFDEPVHMTAVFYCRTARRTDLDNLLKLASDALEGVLFTNDHLIHSLRGRLHRRALGETPRTEIRVAPLRPSKDAA